jgi:hypothetical protein
MKQPITMKKISVLERGTSVDSLARAVSAFGPAVKVAVIHHTENSREWARDIFARIETLGVGEGLQSTWWKMSDLSQPGVLAGAVSKAIHADVILLTIDSTQPLPFAFYVWVESWLPNRLLAPGALVTAIGIGRQLSSLAKKTREYLRTVARQGRLDLLLEERELEAPQRGFGISDRGSASPRLPRALRQIVARESLAWCN